MYALKRSGARGKQICALRIAVIRSKKYCFFISPGTRRQVENDSERSSNICAKGEIILICAEKRGRAESVAPKMFSQKIHVLNSSEKEWRILQVNSKDNQK